MQVEGKGLVLVVGCGHPGVAALVRRAEQVYQQPVYGVVGGLHLMPRDGRVKLGPIPRQKVVASSTPPWRLTSEADVDEAIGFLRASSVRLVGPRQRRLDLQPLRRELRDRLSARPRPRADRGVGKQLS